MTVSSTNTSTRFLGPGGGKQRENLGSGDDRSDVARDPIREPGRLGGDVYRIARLGIVEVVTRLASEKEPTGSIRARRSIVDGGNVAVVHIDRDERLIARLRMPTASVIGQSPE